MGLLIIDLAYPPPPLTFLLISLFASSQQVDPSKFEPKKKARGLPIT